MLWYSANHIQASKLTHCDLTPENNAVLLSGPYQGSPTGSLCPYSWGQCCVTQQTISRLANWLTVTLLLKTMLCYSADHIQASKPTHCIVTRENKALWLSWAYLQTLASPTFTLEPLLDQAEEHLPTEVAEVRRLVGVDEQQVGADLQLLHCCLGCTHIGREINFDYILWRLFPRLRGFRKNVRLFIPPPPSAFFLSGD